MGGGMQPGGGAGGAAPMTGHQAYYAANMATGGTASPWRTLNPMQQASWGAGGGDPGHAAYHDWRMAQPGGGASTPNWASLGSYRQGQWDQAGGLNTNPAINALMPGVAGTASNSAVTPAGLQGVPGGAMPGGMPPQGAPSTTPSPWIGSGMGNALPGTSVNSMAMAPGASGAKGGG